MEITQNVNKVRALSEHGIDENDIKEVRNLTIKIVNEVSEILESFDYMANNILEKIFNQDTYHILQIMIETSLYLDYPDVFTMFASEYLSTVQPTEEVKRLVASGADDSGLIHLIRDELSQHNIGNFLYVVEELEGRRLTKFIGRLYNMVNPWLAWVSIYVDLDKLADCELADIVYDRLIGPFRQVVKEYNENRTYPLINHDFYRHTDYPDSTRPDPLLAVIMNNYEDFVRILKYPLTASEDDIGDHFDFYVDQLTDMGLTLTDQQTEFYRRRFNSWVKML